MGARAFSSSELRRVKSVVRDIKRLEDVTVKRDGNTLTVGELAYTPSVTGDNFHNDKSSLVKAILGPYGSGKSVGACAEIVLHACDMPKCKDGVRRCRYAVIRNTYGELKSTTIRTWLDWFSDLGKTKTNMADSPITFKSTFNDGNGVVELELLFMAFDRPEQIKKLKSLELTGVLIEESCEVPHEVMRHAMGRINRYPKLVDVEQTYRSQILMCTNAPDTDHWFYGLFEVQKPEGFRLFKQPPGLVKNEADEWVVNPDADNINNLPPRYYLDMIEGASEDFIKVYALGQYGAVSTGKPVYNEYNDDLHSSDNLQYDDKLDLNFCWDYGLTPCCAVFQVLPTGHIIVIHEFTSTHSGTEQFVQNVVKPGLATTFPGYKIGFSVGDPAGAAGSQADLRSCIQILDENGFDTEKAYSNSTIERVGAVKKALSTLIDGRPQLVISRGCSTLRKGFLGSYQLERVPGVREDYKDLPKKNFYSHIHDALQYGVMTVLGSTSIKDAPDLGMNYIC